MPRLTQAQSRLSEQLSGHPEGVRESYLGALHALQQEKYPDKFVHFAQSLREVIDQLARANRCPECEKPHGNRKKCLQLTFDPLGDRWYAEPALDELESAYDRLSEAAHHRGKIDCQARKILYEVEAALDHLSGSQTSINSEIDDMLKGPPSLDSAKKIVALQMSPATLSHLIYRMEDCWLPHMRAAGFFEDLQSGESRESRHGWRWPSSAYLQKCSKAFGKDVADVIVSCKTHKERHNPAVYRDFLRCALCMTVADAERVARKALEEKWGDVVGWRELGPKYVEVAEKLYRGGRHSVSTRMLRRALRLELSEFKFGAPNTDGKRDGILRLGVPIGEHVWKESLAKMPALAQKSPLPATRLLDCLLHELIVLDGRAHGLGRGREDEMCWPPTIDPQNRSDTMYSVLINKLRDCVFHAVRNGEGDRAMKILHCRDLNTYRRLELHVYAEFPDKFGQEAALSALWHFGCPRVDHEYCRLLETVFPALPSGVRREITERIDAGYEPAVFELKKRQYGEESAKIAEKRWKMHYLELIKGHLDQRRRRAYEITRKELSEYERPGDSGAAVFEAPEQALLDGKGPDEVFETVKNCEPAESPAPRDGAAEEFAAYVRDNPLECSRRAPLLGSARPRIQYELFDGLHGAVCNDERMEWDGVLSAALDVAVSLSDKQNRLETPEPERYRLRTGYYDPLPPLFSLVREGFQRDSVDFGLRAKARGVVEELARVGAACAEPQHWGKTRSRHMSVRNLNGMSFHIVCRYAAWCQRHDKRQGMAPEARRIFDDYLEKGNHTASRHAVLGAFLPEFYSLEREWARSLPGNVSSKNARIAFWDGYVSCGQLRQDIFDDLWKQYDKFMNGDMLQHPDLAEPHGATIEHVMLAYFYDWQNACDIVEKFLEKRDGESPERCAKQIGLIVGSRGCDPKFNKTKLELLWKHGAFKKCDLGMWFTNTPLDRETTIGLYRNHIRQYRGKILIEHDPVDRLAEYAEEFPSEVAECLEALVLKYEYDAVPREFEDLVRRLFSSGDSHVRSTCRSIHKKAAERELGWEDLPGD